MPCPNCGDETAGRFCPACGQDQTDPRTSLRILLGSALEELISLDGKLMREPLRSRYERSNAGYILNKCNMLPQGDPFDLECELV